MAYSVTIGTCNDPRNKVSKTLSGAQTYTCTPKYPCDILHPTLKIAGTVDSGNMFSFNGRNYYITGLAIDNGCTYVTGTVDALSSWSSSIYGTTQYVARGETDYDLMIPDNLLPVRINEIPSVEGFGITNLKGTEAYVIGLTTCQNVNTLANGVTHENLVTDPNDPNDTPHVE